MRTIEKVLLVEGESRDARLLREMFNEDGSREVDLTRVSSIMGSERYSDNEIWSMKFSMLRGAHGR